MVASELGLKASPSLNSLRKATVDWVFGKLGDRTSADPQMRASFWLQASDNLFARGKSPELKATRSARMPAFFEASNVDLPSYG
jgi:hypothetical protein